MVRDFRPWIGAILLMASALVVAQESQGIPSEIVSMLAPLAGANGGGELRAGGPPADFPIAVIPPGATPSATLSTPSRGMTVVIATGPKLSIGDFEKHESTLVAAGWIATGPRFRGFLRTTNVTSQYPISVCRGADFVSLTSQARAAGGLFVRATLTRDARRTCVATPSMSMTDIDIPRLPPPADARAVGGGGGGGGLDNMTTTLRLETGLAPRAVVEHYERLLVGAGWKVSGRVRDGDEMAMTRFNVPSRIGLPLSAWLSASKLGDTGDVDVFLRVLRNTRDPQSSSFSGTTSLGGAISVTPTGR